VQVVRGEREARRCPAGSGACKECALIPVFVLPAGERESSCRPADLGPSRDGA